MVFTTPTQAEFDKWILKENEIVCENNVLWHEECTKDHQLIWSSFLHFRNVGVFAFYEKNYEFENNEQLNVKALGFFGNIFTLEDEKLWEILN